MNSPSGPPAVRVLSAPDYVALEAPPLEYLVDQFLPHPSTAVLVGEPKSGKSWLALQLAIAVAGGTPLWGLSTKPSRVLYVQIDTPDPLWRDRCSRLQGAGIPLPDNLYMIHPQDLPLHLDIQQEETRRVLRDAINTVQPALIIIDVLRSLHRRKEDSSTDMIDVVETLCRLARGRTLLIIHHTPKLSGRLDQRVVDLPRGTSYLAGRVDMLYGLLDQSLHVVGRIPTPFEVAVGQRLPNGLWAFPSVQYGPAWTALCRKHPHDNHATLAARWVAAHPHASVPTHMVKDYLDRLLDCPHQQQRIKKER